jgi:hypothetical protein
MYRTRQWHSNIVQLLMHYIECSTHIYYTLSSANLILPPSSLMRAHCRSRSAVERQRLVIVGNRLHHQCAHDITEIYTNLDVYSNHGMSVALITKSLTITKLSATIRWSRHIGCSADNTSRSLATSQYTRANIDRCKRR